MVAAKVFGFFMVRRTNTIITLRERLPEGVQERDYEVLNLLEFNSTRKRMSVIIRTPENKILLYCKVRGAAWLRLCDAECVLEYGVRFWGRRGGGVGGSKLLLLAGDDYLMRVVPHTRAQGADTVIYERLARDHPLNDSLKDVTLQHMEEYGSAGLRTLCLSYTELDPDFYDECVARQRAVR